MRFSIIMPVYNVEKYIANSINSVCLQTYRDFELILVNDGSPDCSIEIAKGLLDGYDFQYKIINQENKGVSSARNEGIRNAKGEWLVFPDSDDLLHHKTLEIVNYAIEKEAKCDAIFLNYLLIKKSSNLKISASISEDYEVFDKDEIIDMFLHRKAKLFAPGTIIKKAFIDKHQLKYDESVKYSEDQLFLWKLIEKIEYAVILKGKMYNYLIRPQSTMTSSQVEKIMTGFKAFKLFQEDILKNKERMGEYGEFILPRWILGVLHASSKYMDYRTFCDLSNKLEYKRNVKKLLHDNEIKAKILSFVCVNNLLIFWLIARIL